MILWQSAKSGVIRGQIINTPAWAGARPRAGEGWCRRPLWCRYWRGHGTRPRGRTAARPRAAGQWGEGRVRGPPGWSAARTRPAPAPATTHSEIVKLGWAGLGWAGLGWAGRVTWRAAARHRAAAGRPAGWVVRCVVRGGDGWEQHQSTAVPLVTSTSSPVCSHLCVSVSSRLCPPPGGSSGQDSRVGRLHPAPLAPRPRPRGAPGQRPHHEVPRGGGEPGGRGRDGRLPPPQPDGHVPGPRHQHHGLEEHEPGEGQLLLGLLMMRAPVI